MKPGAFADDPRQALNAERRFWTFALLVGCDFFKNCAAMCCKNARKWPGAMVFLLGKKWRLENQTCHVVAPS